tara:strand:- start:7 stop:990 length:984 start_codon:yes stop_codon:yes gene_type:complete
MRTTKYKLRQIIKEEVQLRLTEYYVKKEIQILFEDSEDPEVQKAREEYRRLSRQGKKIPAALALFLGIGFGGLKYATDQHSDTKAAATDARVTQNIDAANTDEAQLKDFADQLNNQYAFRWGKGNNSVVYAPGSKGEITVLPASYSLAVQALQDKKTNAERIEQGLRPTERYGEIDLDNAGGDKLEYQGDYEQNIDNFFKTHKGKFVNALDVVAAHDELDTVPVEGTESMVVMVHPDLISADYYLPELGMTAADFYNSQYGEFMGDGEKGALEQPDEEMTVTPDDYSIRTRGQLDPELIQKTKERAASLKESKITWKNYKNRKKVLA